MEVNDRIFVAGHRGLVGRALVSELEARGYSRILRFTRNEYDLVRQEEVERLFEEHAIDYVLLAAAKVGGIHANDSFPAEFIYQNLMIASNVIHASHQWGVKGLLFLGSSCIYPKAAQQPMVEESLLSGPLEPTNEPYALAKIAGIKLCESYNRQYGTDFRSVMPTNLYGPGDNFHPRFSHVIPGLIRRIHESHVRAESHVGIWGTGEARREFLYVEDMARAAIHVMSLERRDLSTVISERVSHLNVGTGQEVTVRHLAETIASVVGFAGELRFESNKPEGPERKLVDSGRLSALGWRPKVDLRDGIERTYQWFLANAVHSDAQ